jgi:hypothetical protein
MAESEQLDWLDWHRPYDDPNSRLSRRLAVVQRLLRDALDAAPAGDITLVSMCAGQGRDVLPVLADHRRREDVRALLVELDPRNTAIARESARAANLSRVEVLCADAAVTDSYKRFVPAEVILACGIFGNIAREDIMRTVEHLPSLGAPNATVLWTRGRFGEDDTVPEDIRRWFSGAGFEEIAWEGPGDQTYSVGAARLVSPRPFERGLRLFTFFR